MGGYPARGIVLFLKPSCIYVHLEGIPASTQQQKSTITKLGHCFPLIFFFCLGTKENCSMRSHWFNALTYFAGEIKFQSPLPLVTIWHHHSPTAVAGKQLLTPILNDNHGKTFAPFCSAHQKFHRVVSSALTQLVFVPKDFPVYKKIKLELITFY